MSLPSQEISERLNDNWAEGFNSMKWRIYAMRMALDKLELETRDDDVYALQEALASISEAAVATEEIVKQRIRKAEAAAKQPELKGTGSG